VSVGAYIRNTLTVDKNMTREDALFDMLRRAWPYARLARADFDAVGRMLADGWTSRFGPTRTARVLGSVSLVGLMMIVLPLGLVPAIAGFALLGLGVCTSFPLMLSAAARLGDRPAAENVAAVTMTMTFINLGTPVLIR
jgi:hypothetical protein